MVHLRRSLSTKAERTRRRSKATTQTIRRRRRARLLQHNHGVRHADRRDALGTRAEIRQVKYLNNIVEQDHRAVKRLVRPMLGFKSFRSAVATLAGIELMDMIRKGQLRTTGESRPAQQFYSLAW
jgi:transposase-like protein